MCVFDIFEEMSYSELSKIKACLVIACLDSDGKSFTESHVLADGDPRGFFFCRTLEILPNGS